MRIVVVEDETTIREGMAKILETINPKYELVGTASDGMSGYELIQKASPDLVIMDIRMPKMNGLEMLERLREKGCQSRFVVLSAYSEFDYAKRAIDSGIVSYLLKPIKLPELKSALRQAEESIEKEHNRGNAFSIDTIFLGCLNGQLKADVSFDAMTKEWYGFTVQEPVEVFMVWLGEGYEEQKKRARDLIEHAAEQSVKSCAYIKENDNWKTLLLILYRLQPGQTRFPRYRDVVAPMLGRNLDKPHIFIWKRAESLLKVSNTLREMKAELEWNLWFRENHLINQEEIESIPIIPVKYPIELEEQAKQAILKKDKRNLEECYQKLIDYFRAKKCRPRQMKDMLIRFNWSLASVQRERKEETNLRIHAILQNLVTVVSWEEIQGEMEEFINLICDSSKLNNKNSTSEMVKKAQELIRNYYSQGITLEETARKLFVSEEYLSTQFKKETGMSFTETARKYRIEKVKQLLLDTHLKLNQIAELAGYSDPKYMSRVFKEEVGMLPGEFRKLSH